MWYNYVYEKEKVGRIMDRRLSNMIRGMIISERFNEFKFSIETNNPSFDDITHFKLSLRYEEHMICELAIRIIRIQTDASNDDVLKWTRRGVVEWLYVPRQFQKIGVERKMLVELEKMATLYKLDALVLTLMEEYSWQYKRNDIVLDRQSLANLGYKMKWKTGETQTYVWEG